MSRTTELLSKTKYSNVDELLNEAKKIAIDNDWLQLSIERYIRTGSELELDIIIDAQ
ncbi:MAG: hypothetical protein ACE5KT_07970 [Methanosarcinales archaeon]